MKKNKLQVKLLLITLCLSYHSEIFSQDYHWQFDDNQVVTNSGYTNTLEGTAHDMFIHGKNDKALGLKKDGSSFPYSNNVSIGITGSYSISFWVNPSYIKENAGEEYFIANKRDGVQQFLI